MRAADLSAHGRRTREDKRKRYSKAPHYGFTVDTMMPLPAAFGKM